MYKFMNIFCYCIYFGDKYEYKSNSQSVHSAQIRAAYILSMCQTEVL